MKKTLCGILALALFVSLLAGCAGSKKSNVKTGANEQDLNLTYFAKKETDYNEEKNIFNEAGKRTHVYLKHEISQNVTDLEQALSLIVASNAMTDVIYSHTRKSFVNYGSQGAFRALNDLIDKYAPNYKAFLEQNPEIKKFTSTSNGVIYYIPFVLDGKTSTGWFIRQDWLDKLGLQMPETLEDFYNIMVAFRDRDPNGNGKKDEVPYFGTGESAKRIIYDFFGLFDARMDFRYASGKVTYGPMEPQFKTAMKTIQKWYQEGLIDKELFTRTKTREYFFGNNLGGITHNWFGSTAGYNEIFKNQVPGIHIVPMAPPAGMDGAKRELQRRDKGMQEGWTMSAKNKYPVETMKYFDFWWSEEGRRLANFGIEGEQYEMVEGQPKFKESVLNAKSKTAVSALRMVGAQTDFGFWQDFNYERQWLNPIALKGMDMYVNNQYLQEELPKLTYDQDDQKYLQLTERIDTYLSETITKWVLSNANIDVEYQLFLNKLEDLGAGELTTIEQNAYNRYLSK